jgi:hypothetical protein
LELADGRKVRQQGCHVRIMPKDEKKLGVWIYMLDLKHIGWGGPRIANHLNDLGIPSPDAGRTRTDHGVKHFVSGKWSTRTVLELCRNPAIVGIVSAGRRSDGAHRRIGADGPRLLSESDRDANDNPKLIQNDKDVVISSPTGFDAKYDSTKWQEIADRMEERGRCQRNIPRAKDPAKYPLAACVRDLTDDCGSTMYGRPHGNRSLYVCGRYMRSGGGDCNNNAVDAEALLRSTIHDLKQLTILAGGREQIRRRLEVDRSKEANGRVDEVGVNATPTTINVRQKRRKLLSMVSEMIPSVPLFFD